MELVTIAKIELYRQNPTGSPVETYTITVNDSSETTLKGAIARLAERIGDKHVTEQSLVKTEGRFFNGTEWTIAFKIADGRSFSSSEYAKCQVDPALRVGDRYFKLTEIPGVARSS